MSDVIMSPTEHLESIGEFAIQPLARPLEQFSDISNMASVARDERMTAAISVLLDALMEIEAPLKLDRGVIDTLIHRIDEKMSDILDRVLHDPEFQSLEALWSSIHDLSAYASASENVQIEVLDVEKRELAEDFSDSEQLESSALYKHVYVDEYDTPGGEPISAIISDYEFGAARADIDLLDAISEVAQLAHTPFLTNISPKFFGKSHWDDVVAIEDLDAFFSRAEFIAWNALREKRSARYLGLFMPSVLGRVPYGAEQPCRSFHYHERVENADHCLWKKSVFAFSENLAKSFIQDGWLVNIVGPESGGKVSGLPVFHYPDLPVKKSVIPTQVLIPESVEMRLANLGFIPISYYKNTDFACFFSASSLKSPDIYDDDTATANGKVNTKLPYIFLISRLAHYLKVLQRENIGASKNASQLQDELNRWLQGLVTRMPDPDPEVLSKHPLSAAEVEVSPMDAQPGYYRVDLKVMPHIKIDGIDLTLSLVSRLPSNEN